MVNGLHWEKKPWIFPMPSYDFTFQIEASRLYHWAPIPRVRKVLDNITIASGKRGNDKEYDISIRFKFDSLSQKLWVFQINVEIFRIETFLTLILLHQIEEFLS